MPQGFIYYYIIYSITMAAIPSSPITIPPLPLPYPPTTPSLSFSINLHDAPPPSPPLRPAPPPLWHLLPAKFYMHHDKTRTANGSLPTYLPTYQPGSGNLLKHATNFSPLFRSTFLPSSVSVFMMATHSSCSSSSGVSRSKSSWSSKCFAIHMWRSSTSVIVYATPPGFST